MNLVFYESLLYSYYLRSRLEEYVGIINKSFLVAEIAYFMEYYKIEISILIDYLS
jgi:hypothetical protein